MPCFNPGPRVGQPAFPRWVCLAPSSEGASRADAPVARGLCPVPPAALMINGVCWLWVSPCAGLCSVVPMPTAKPSWCPSGARYASQGEWNSVIGTINDQRDIFHGKCSARYFDPTHNHCDSNDPFVRLKSYNYHELVLICDTPV